MIGCTVQSIPIIINYPYPVGYDTINYYLPILYQFHTSGFDWNTSLPVYVVIVHYLSKILLNDPYLSFNVVNASLYGVFGVSILFILINIFRMSPYFSLWSCVFVLLQLSMLRISWDLHRDILAIIFLNFVVIIIHQLYTINHSVKKKLVFYICIFCITSISVLSDRMLSLLLITSSLIFSLVKRDRYLFALNLSFVLVFIAYVYSFNNVTFLSFRSDIVDTLFNPIFNKNSFDVLNLTVLFLTLNGILIPTFVIGFLKGLKRLNFLVIPTTISLVFSFTWTVIPNYEYLVPERWIIVFGVFISIYASFGLYVLSVHIRSKRVRYVFYYCIMAIFFAYGFIFMIAPYGSITTLPSYFNSYTGFIFPLSMSLNSMEIPQNRDVVNIIDWVNNHTPNDSSVIATLHWRGWFHLFLNSSHNYIYSETHLKSNGKTVFESFEDLKKSSSTNNLKSLFCVKDPKHQLFKHHIYMVNIGREYYDKTDLIPVFSFGKLNVYNVSTMLCDS